VAYTAGLNLDTHLPGLWLGNVPFHQLERGIGFGNLRDFHAGHRVIPLISL
jgi:hypothetical protein